MLHIDTEDDLNLENIAKGLGPEWSYIRQDKDQDIYGARLAHKDGLALTVDTPYHAREHQVRIALHIPRELLDHRPYNADTPEITVTLTRPNAALAKDIERRLLPTTATHARPR
jgi:hypothetical protein